MASVGKVEETIKLLGNSTPDVLPQRPAGGTQVPWAIAMPHVVRSIAFCVASPLAILLLNVEDLINGGCKCMKDVNTFLTSSPEVIAGVC